MFDHDDATPLAARCTLVVLQSSELQALQERLDSQVAAAKQAEDNARAAEKKAAEQATIAAAARAEVGRGAKV